MESFNEIHYSGKGDIHVQPPPASLTDLMVMKVYRATQPSLA